MVFLSREDRRLTEKYIEYKRLCKEIERRERRG